LNINVEKIDDINYVVSGSVDNSVIEQKIEALTNKAKKESKDEEIKEEQIQQVAAEEVFREFIDAGVEKAGIDVESLLGQPGLKRYEKTADKVIFEVELATSPEIDFIGVTFDDILPSYTKPTADEKAIEKKMKEFSINQAPFTPLASPKAVENGDVTVIDFTGFVDGKEFEGGKAEKFNLKIGSKSFIEGFEDQLIGMEYGEERTVTITFPTEYSQKDLAGKSAEFHVKLHEIQEQIPIAIDDALAQKILGNPSAKVKQLKEKFSDQIVSEELSQLYMDELKPVIVEGLLKKFQFTLPNNIVEQEIFAKANEKIQYLPEQERNTILKDKEKLLSIRESVRQDAENTIKKALIVEAMAKKEGIEADEQEAIAALTYQAMMVKQNPQALIKYYQENKLMHTVQLALIEDKLFGKMLGFDK
jgi:trigger factor